MEEYRSGDSEGRLFLRDTYSQHYRDLGVHENSMRWNANTRTFVFCKSLREAIQEQVQKDFNDVATETEMIHLKESIGLSWHHMLWGMEARTGRGRPKKVEPVEHVDLTAMD